MCVGFAAQEFKNSQTRLWPCLGVSVDPRPGPPRPLPKAGAAHTGGPGYRAEPPPARPGARARGGFYQSRTPPHPSVVWNPHSCWIWLCFPEKTPKHQCTRDGGGSWVGPKGRSGPRTPDPGVRACHKQSPDTNLVLSVPSPALPVCVQHQAGRAGRSATVSAFICWTKTVVISIPPVTSLWKTHGDKTWPWKFTRAALGGPPTEGP